MDTKPYALTAMFTEVKALMEAAHALREHGFKNWDIYVPFPVHGLDKAMGMKRSIVPRFTLAGGTVGFFTGMLITWYMNGFDYPLTVGGKPLWSVVYPFPIVYELTILLAAFGTLFGMFFTNRLPRHNHPIFEHPQFKRALDDQFLVAIEAQDPLCDAQKTPELLQKLGGQEIAWVNHPEHKTTACKSC